jgi:predicted TPR repeat methyltransferase
VDRRASYAEVLAGEGAYAEAAEVMEQALERAAHWAAGWASLGRYREELGEIDRAIDAWKRSAELDHEGIYGAALKLVAHGVEKVVRAGAYVEALFDDYAGHFEYSLVGRLGYGVPAELMEMINATGRVAGGTAYDLGCGTGLMGVQLRPTVRRLEGIDISEEMLGEAKRKAVYDRLSKADLADFLDRADAGEVSVVTATDVLNYTGPLAPVLTRVHRVLMDGGLFGFSLELSEGPEPEVLQRSLRYAHNGDAARAASVAAGFEIVAERETVLRRDRGQPVRGVLMVLRR